VVNTDFTIDLITALWLGFMGACVGSFLNVVAYRVPLGMSVVWKPSHCPHCNHPIRARDNVPVLGWLMLRGRCRDCGAPISPRYAIVEAIMGIAFFLLAYLELFRGGATVFGGPLTDLRGAMDIVWMPQWRVIGQYVYHALLASVAMTLVLLRLDGNIIRGKLIIWSVVLLALYLLPAMFIS
jgi:leader peptidase (prepilin peptidase)/N-methyltransferase